MRIAIVNVALAALCLLAACGGRDRHMDAGFDAGPVVPTGPIHFRSCDPVMFDAGPPPDLGPPQACFGRATMDCSTYSTGTCPAALGCVVTQCRGFPVSCASNGTMSACSAAMGCTWTGTACMGMPRACSTFTDMDACGHQTGCVWSTTMSCGGITTPCEALNAATCGSQPGCSTTNPDAGVMVDAGLAGCTACAGSAPVALHVVKGPEPVTAVAGALVHFESSCGPSMDLTTAADGSLHVDLDRSMGAWTMTVGATGLTAVSVVGVSEIEFDGDVRLDPMTPSSPMNIGAVGIVDHPSSAGDTIQVDGYDFMTTTAGAGGTWTSTFLLNTWPVPLQFCATELNGLGEAVNLVCSVPTARSSMPVSGVTMTFDSAVTPTRSTIPIMLPSGGVFTSGALASQPLVTNLIAYEGDPSVIVGSAAYDEATNALTIVSFPDVVAANRTLVQLMGAGYFLTVDVADIATASVAVPQLDALAATGASLGDATIGGSGAGWDALGFYIGVLDAGGAPVRPGWRVFVPLNGGTAVAAEVPHLPHGLTPSSLGLVAPAASAAIAMKLHRSRPWSMRASAFSPREEAMSIGAQSVVMLDTAGR